MIAGGFYLFSSCTFDDRLWLLLVMAPRGVVEDDERCWIASTFSQGTFPVFRKCAKYMQP